MEFGFNMPNYNLAGILRVEEKAQHRIAFEAPWNNMIDRKLLRWSSGPVVPLYGSMAGSLIVEDREGER